MAGLSFTTRAEIPPFLLGTPRPEPNCTLEYADLFTGYGDRQGTRRVREAQAKAFCFTCPLRIPCRDWATKTGQTGVWGGTDDTQRAMARRFKGFPGEPRFADAA